MKLFSKTVLSMLTVLVIANSAFAQDDVRPEQKEGHILCHLTNDNENTETWSEKWVYVDVRKQAGSDESEPYKNNQLRFKLGSYTYDINTLNFGKIILIVSLNRQNRAATGTDIPESMIGKTADVGGLRVEFFSNGEIGEISCGDAGTSINPYNN